MLEHRYHVLLWLREAPRSCLLGQRLKGPMHWIHATEVTWGQQSKRGKSEFLQLGSSAIGWMQVCPAAAHRDTWETPAWGWTQDLCAETT